MQEVMNIHFGEILYSHGSIIVRQAAFAKNSRVRAVKMTNILETAEVFSPLSSSAV
jgi:hypothetical protein